MKAQTVIKQFKAMPPKHRAEVAKFVVATDDSWIPESFKRGMADAEAGRFAGMDACIGRITSSRKRERCSRYSTAAASRRGTFSITSMPCCIIQPTARVLRRI
jgi:hypothetical protein